MTARKPTLNLIGAGRLGQTLARLWAQAGVFTVQDVLTRSSASAQAACEFIGTGTPARGLETMRPADVWLIATTDAQIAASAAALATHQAQVPDPGMLSHALPTSLADAAPNPRHAPAAVHCSGALSADQLAPLAALGWHTASAHPILSFATARAACTQFSGTPCALEGEPAARTLLQQAFTAIGAQCFEVSSQDKLLYHAAAVFATNFLPVLQSVAEDAWRASGVPPALLPHLRASLLNNAVANITRLGPQGALTGPAARGDTAAIARQAAAVDAWDEKSGAAYMALSDLALRLAGHVPSAKAAADSGQARPSPGIGGAALP